MNLLETQGNLPFVILISGQSGTGKTGSLASLIDAGYKLRILDIDKGIQILQAAGVVKDRTKLANVEYEQFGDKLIAKPSGKGGTETLGYLTDPTTYSDVIKKLNSEWKDSKGNSLGKPSSWGKDTILVIDSFSFLCDACLNFQKLLAGRKELPTQLQDWHAAGQQLTMFLQYLTSLSCHVICITHIRTEHVREGKDDTQVIFAEFPQALAEKFSSSVGKFFNTLLLYGIDSSKKRKIYTQTPLTSKFVGVKNSVAITAKAEYPVETGLAEIFALAK